MHVVALIGADPDQIGKRVGAEVGGEFLIRHDLCHAGGIVAHIGEVHEGVVLLGIELGDDLAVAAHRRIFQHLVVRRHGLHIGLPAMASGLELIHQILAREKMCPAGRRGDLRIGQKLARGGGIVGIGDELLGLAGHIGAGLAIVEDPLSVA